MKVTVFGDVHKTEEYGIPHPEASDVQGVVVLGYDPATDKWLALKWARGGTIWLPGGGREGSESYAAAAVRELREETGYRTFKEQVQLGGPIVSHYYNDKKAVFRRSYSFAYLFLLERDNTGRQELEEHEDFIVMWLEYGSLRNAIEQTGGGVEHWLAVLAKAHEYVAENKFVVGR